MSNPGQEAVDNQVLRELRDSVKELKKSTDNSNCIMILLTIVLVVLTGVLIFQSS